jgi:hypothetical protein
LGAASLVFVAQPGGAAKPWPGTELRSTLEKAFAERGLKYCTDRSDNISLLPSYEKDDVSVFSQADWSDPRCPLDVFRNSVVGGNPDHIGTPIHAGWHRRGRETPPSASRPCTGAIGSDDPIPRWSNQMWRLNDDSPWRNRTNLGSSHIRSMGNKACLATNTSGGPAPTTW